MSKPSSLKRNVIQSFLLFAVTSGLFFVLTGAIAIKTIESRLVEERLRAIAKWALPRHVARLPVDLPDGVNFYRDEAIPLPLRGLAQGLSEPTIGGDVINVLTGKDATGDYVVADYASDYDELEWLIFSAFAVGFVGFLVVSFLIGQYLYRRIVNPISALAASVRSNSVTSDPSVLSDVDEIGLLAKVFSARTEELNQLLARERFFTGDVSHELRTPLTVITGAAEILASKTQDRPDLHAAAERILRAARDASDAVSTLLLLARTPEQVGGPETEIAPVVRAEVDRYQTLLRNKPVSLQLQVESGFTVRIRRELLAIAIGNLIRNACQYTEKGSILVRIVRNAVVIQDTGPGVPQSVCDQLVTPSVNTHARSSGSGLGLALVTRICEQMGAALTVKNGTELGAAFTVHFQPDLTKS